MAVPKRKLLRQEETKDVRLYGSSKLLHLQSVLTAVNISSLIEFVRTAVYTTAEK